MIRPVSSTHLLGPDPLSPVASTAVAGSHGLVSTGWRRRTVLMLKEVERSYLKNPTPMRSQESHEHGLNRFHINTLGKRGPGERAGTVLLL